jgi:hypothetical protein
MQTLCFLNDAPPAGYEHDAWWFRARYLARWFRRGRLIGWPSRSQNLTAIYFLSREHLEEYIETFLARIIENSLARIQTAVKTVDVFEGIPCGALPSASKIYCNNEVPTVWLLDTLTNLKMSCWLRAIVLEHIFNLSSNTGSHYGEPVHGLAPSTSNDSLSLYSCVTLCLSSQFLFFWFIESLHQFILVVFWTHLNALSLTLKADTEPTRREVKCRCSSWKILLLHFS